MLRGALATRAVDGTVGEGDVGGVRGGEVRGKAQGGVAVVLTVLGEKGKEGDDEITSGLIEEEGEGDRNSHNWPAPETNEAASEVVRCVAMHFRSDCLAFIAEMRRWEQQQGEVRAAHGQRRVRPRVTSTGKGGDRW